MAQPADEFHDAVDRFFSEHVLAGNVDYARAASSPANLRDLRERIANIELAMLPRPERAAVLINAYNVLVISSIAAHWPVRSPKDIPGFFDGRKHVIGGMSLTLDELEKEHLFPLLPDPRLHLVLVCAAKSCPPLPGAAFRGGMLESQLAAAAAAALREPDILKLTGAHTAELSMIFSWYLSDFGGETGLRRFCRAYGRALPDDATLTYMPYDWEINSVSAPQAAPVRGSLQFFTPATLLEPGQIEAKLFANLYTQSAYRDGSGRRIATGVRESWLTGILSFMYGLSDAVNIGGDLYVRSAARAGEASSPLLPLRFASVHGESRAALHALAPRLKIAPFRRAGPAVLRKLTLQTLLLLPVSDDPEQGGGVFLDYEDVQWWTQAFYDVDLSTRVLLYVETGINVRFDGSRSRAVLSTPLKVFANYYPAQRWTLYLPFEAVPTWGGAGDDLWSSVYLQSGLGIKYQLSPALEAEALWTSFFAGSNSGAGQTVNLGFRFIR